MHKYVVYKLRKQYPFYGLFGKEEQAESEAYLFVLFFFSLLIINLDILI